MNLFELVGFVGGIAGLAIGAFTGDTHGGVVGAVVGAIAGVVGGHVSGVGLISALFWFGIRRERWQARRSPAPILIATGPLKERLSRRAQKSACVAGRRCSEKSSSKGLWEVRRYRLQVSGPVLQVVGDRGWAGQPHQPHQVRPQVVRVTARKNPTLLDRR